MPFWLRRDGYTKEPYDGYTKEPDSFATQACGTDLPEAWLRTVVGLKPVRFQVTCLNQSSFPLQHQLCQLLKKAFKILRCDTVKKATPKGCQIALSQEPVTLILGLPGSKLVLDYDQYFFKLHILA